MTQEELNQQIAELISSYLSEHAKVIEKPVEKIVEKQAEIPNDKIVLSADTFSKIINIISYAENMNLIDPILQDIYDDVKKNRTSLSKNERIVLDRYKRHAPTYRSFIDLINDMHK